jgi:multidrug efflux pump subunit AcrB
MNPGEFSIRNDRVVFVAMLLVLVGGLVAYKNMGRLEDPEFTIKEALIITPYPGASAEEVAKEVTNPIESALQQLDQLKRVDSESSRGRSVVTAVIHDRFHKDRIPQVWDELRRKIADVQPQLPPSVRGRSMVIDDFGDVYGIFLAITGDGFSFAELRRYAEFMRRELLLAPNVNKVELFGAQQEVVFLEISRQRLAQLGINEEQIYSHLQARNVAADGGLVRVGDQHIALDPQGGFRSADGMLELVIGSDQTGRQLFLRDVASLERGDQDPPRRLLRFDGKPAIGLGISTVQGGNVVTMGAGVRRKLEEIKPYQPLGIEIGEINFQPEAVTQATNEFMFNLGKAVTIVFVVLLFAMGRKTGVIIGLVLLVTIMATFAVMYMKAHHRPVYAHGQRDHRRRGDQGRDRVRRGQAQGGPRGGRAEPVATLRSDGHWRYCLRGHRPVGGFDRRILQLAVLGYPDLPEPELDIVDYHHAAPELPIFQTDRWWSIRKQRSVWGPVLPGLP